jgi:hypothetical protein
MPFLFIAASNEKIPRRSPSVWFGDKQKEKADHDMNAPNFRRMGKCRRAAMLIFTSCLLAGAILISS